MSPLKTRLIKRIKAEGPLSVASYMAACLFDPVDGFYPTRDPLGSEGDFITAPEVSQMFGEMIGIWCVQSWRDMGCPDRLDLIELGPGRGVMMSDILRSAQIDAAFMRALHVTLVEASPALEAVQGQTLASAPCPVNWADSLVMAPRGPSLIIGNEFIDCLPIRQFVRRDGDWYERLVTIDPDDDQALIFALSLASATAEDFSGFLNPKDGDLVEICPGSAQIIDEIRARFEVAGGRALFIDYGPAQSETGDTLQAIRKHKKVDPLSAPGTADLTARVDFGMIARLARTADLQAYGPTSQAAFLGTLGIEARAARLAATSPAAKEKLARQFHRLTSKDQMGELFKVVCFQSSGLPDPIGFS